MFNVIYLSLTNLSVKDAYYNKLLSHNIIIKDKGYFPIILAYNNTNVGIYAIKNNKVKLLFIINCNNKLEKRLVLYKILFYLLIRRKFKFIYIRYPRPDLFFILFLIILKIKIIKIFYEIPTYPFTKEFNKLFSISGLYERICTLFFFPITLLLTDYVLVVAYSQKKILFKTVIKIENGVSDLNYIKKNIKSSKIIKLISVINFNETNNRHGLDRLLKGLSVYDQSFRSVELLLVGDVSLSNLKEEILKGVNKGYLKILGNLNNDELKKYYTIADIGIGNLGFHRISVNYSSSLKEREYLEYGLPYISSSQDYMVRDNCNFRLKILNNDDIVRISSIIIFYDNFINRKNQYIELKEYTKKHLNWYKAMENFHNLI
jgi:glycosyltransferase involved in cell wall biosynthesis